MPGIGVWNCVVWTATSAARGYLILLETTPVLLQKYVGQQHSIGLEGGNSWGIQALVGRRSTTIVLIQENCRVERSWHFMPWTRESL